jgi:hypothetical protein
VQEPSQIRTAGAAAQALLNPERIQKLDKQIIRA